MPEAGPDSLDLMVHRRIIVDTSAEPLRDSIQALSEKLSVALRTRMGCYMLKRET